MGINLRIKRFNLQSQIHVRFPTLENQIQMNKFTDCFQINHLTEHSYSEKVTSKKKTQPNFV
jgi:hypothetical protein